MIERRQNDALTDKQEAILEAAQTLMVEDGYAAVSARKVAAAAGVKPALLQHYFPTMEKLFLAVYRRAAEQAITRQIEALRSDRPIEALWELSLDTGRTGLAVEFMALANHRKSICAEIALYTHRSRLLVSEALSRLLPATLFPPDAYPADGMALLLVGAARALVMEQAMGLTTGHEAAQAIVQAVLAEMERIVR